MPWQTAFPSTACATVAPLRVDALSNAGEEAAQRYREAPETAQLDPRDCVVLRSPWMRRAILVLLVLCVGACATYREDLNRGQRLYEEHEYERALAIWRYLEQGVVPEGAVLKTR